MSDDVWGDNRGVWREVVDGLPDGAVAVDLEGVIRYLNPSFLTMVGYDEWELLGQAAPFPFWPDEHKQTIGAAFSRTLAGDPVDLDLVFKRKSGERFPVIVHAGPVRIEGQLVGHLGTVKDITERRALQSALVRSEERWRSVAENPFDFVVTLDRDYRYSYVNHTAPGLTRADLIGKATPFDFTDPEHHAVMRAAFDAAFDKAEPGFYEVFVSSLKRWYSTIVGPIVEEGKVTGISLMTRDVTSQKHAEAALRQAQRMETLGRLAGGIAHDFNNLLVPILGNTDLLLGTVSEADPNVPLLQDIADAATRAQQLVSRVLLYGRASSERLENTRVQDVAQEVMRFLRSGLPQNVQVEASLDPACPPILAAPAEVHQVVSNLCMNAVQALTAEGGKVQIRVALCTDGNSPQVQLVVEDNGPGIEAEVQSRVFEPFFTTRAVGDGTGLGLSIVQAVVTRYGGSVSLGTSVPHGARFEVLFPVAPSGETSDAPSPTRGPKSAGRNLRGVILCVDDEELVLRLMLRTLEGAGHTAIGFGTASAALAHLRRAPASVDCVLSDVSMPQMSGLELAETLFLEQPALPVILVTGHYVDGQGALTKNVRCILQKPQTQGALLVAIAQALGSKSPHQYGE